MRRNKQPLKNSALANLLLVAALAAPALITPANAQTASQKPSVDVRRVGARLTCRCGCPDSVATCNMLECSFSKPAKERIAQMQAVGNTDQKIVQAFVQDYGNSIYLAPPNAFGWIVPYAAVLAGLAVILLFVAKYRKPKPMAVIGSPAPDDPELAKYKDQIEKQLANLDS
jgi:cytochrome c-type biogenesis protein CcmH/NrfF